MSNNFVLFAQNCFQQFDDLESDQFLQNTKQNSFQNYIDAIFGGNTSIDNQKIIVKTSFSLYYTKIELGRVVIVSERVSLRSVLYKIQIWFVQLRKQIPQQRMKLVLFSRKYQSTIERVIDRSYNVSFFIYSRSSNRTIHFSLPCCYLILLRQNWVALSARSRGENVTNCVLRDLFVVLYMSV